ncbi:family 43 glycosylhydrolase [Paenibacillus sp. LMG 31456]|uniref:Family 43 glycosylhydrolase n=1 Tax=Paenibacillus foliorum TaxID=2654974 RepID=A0A972GUF6_9BACL|nr:glycoside hydrolase family 43 protein [Paenibacillus foliorum]NOU96897.1 family 43 glycosylhydrolase [Paenibacillus foliorum]
MSNPINRFPNPVLPGDHPDPSVVRVGSDYYVVTSTFQYFPGVMIHHSRDLVHWKPIGHVITRRSQLDLTGVPDSHGVFAPDISYYDGKFWVVVPYFHGQPRCTNVLYVADCPEGPYSDGIVLNHHFIDPSIFNDDDGRRYLAFGGGWVQELAGDGSRLVGEPKQVWPGTGGSTPEAPHILKRSGWYYLLLAEGGTAFGHKETIARSRSVWGPYEPCPLNPVLTQRDPNKPLQKAGHGKLVDDPHGNWWMLHLGGRPLTPNGSTPLGRETFLEPVRWTDDGWLEVGDSGEPAEWIELPAGMERLPDQHTYAVDAVNALDETDRFTEPRLSPVWEWVRHPLQDSFRLTGEGLELDCAPYSLYVPGETLLLTRRWEHFAFEAEVRLSFEPQTLGEEAGLLLYRDMDGMLLVSIRNGIGQTAGQKLDVSRLHEKQEYDGLYLQIDRSEKCFRNQLYQQKLEVAIGTDIWLKTRLDAINRRFTFTYSTDGVKYEPIDLTVPADFLYPENFARYKCYTAPRVGLFALGVMYQPQGKALFKQFTYRGQTD